MLQRLPLNRKFTLCAATAVAVSLLSAAGSQARATPVDTGSSPASSKKSTPPARSLRTRKRPDAKQEIARYSKILDSQPNNAAAWMGRGKAYVARREYTLALADYERAVQIAPQSASARYGCAAVRLLLQEQSARLSAIAKPTQTSSAPVLDGSQFDDDGTIRSHVAPSAPTLAQK